MRVVNEKVMYRKRLAIFIAIILSFFHSFTNCFAGTGPSENGFVYLHPIFDNSLWKYASDSIDITIPQQLCDTKPYRYFAAGTADSSCGLIIDSTGNVSILTARLGERESQCDHIKFILDNSIATSLTVNRDAAAAFIHKNDNLDTLYFAYQNAKTGYTIYTILKNGTIKDSSVFNLTNASNKVITSIHSAANGNQKGFWITGSNGLVRFISVSSTGIGTVTNYDISTTDSICYASSKIAFSTTGNIYKWSNNRLAKAISNSSPLIYANDRMMVGVSGITANVDTSWIEHSGSTVEGIHAGNISSSYKGTVAEYIDNKWTYNNVVICDLPSKFKTIIPDSLMKLIDKPNTDIRSKGNDTFTIVMTDPDLNTEVPNVLVDPGNYAKSVINNLPYKLYGRSSDLPCEIGIAKMNSDTFRVIVHGDSIFYEANVLLGVNNFICNNAVWSKKKLRGGLPSFSHMVIIRVGNDSLSINTMGSVAIATKNLSASAKTEIILRNRVLSCIFSENNHSDGELSLWTIDGRLLLSKKFTKDVKRIEVPLIYSNQMVISRFRFSDGTVIERTITNLR